MIKVNRWFALVVVLVIGALALTVLSPRIKANIIYERPIWDMTSEVNGSEELIFWESASPEMQINLGYFYVFHNILFGTVAAIAIAFILKIVHMAKYGRK